MDIMHGIWCDFKREELIDHLRRKSQERAATDPVKANYFRVISERLASSGAFPGDEWRESETAYRLSRYEMQDLEIV